ncbi:ClpXP protease specificity-enhancing factor [Agitococcus lubricus]|uniref:Stringent starvation protein B n=1 Tax=Agitococcus lubricus TaxID=1077255 RepID=A0A2T5J0P9_9GAMM|nr:ClpXP protease specificity-enhancing factor [Agitococcus lubricus]PTQ89885.1 stringent starvation protein B [Agitococcus lubricus]
MTPSRPYLVRAMYEWLVDNNATPYLLLDATHPQVRVPIQHIKDGKIVLNIAPHAVKDFFVRNEDISFSARFGGVPMAIYAPMVAVLAVYARENGQGMFFDSHEEFEEVTESTTTTATPTVTLESISSDTSPMSDVEAERPKSTGRPSLTIVK